MSSKTNRGKRRRKRKVRVVDVAGFAALALIIAFVIYMGFSPEAISPNATQTKSDTASSTSETLLRAAIIDQLGSNFPNSEFTESIKTLMDNTGFDVDIYDPNSVTVNLYGSLGGRGYRIIIFRVHAGVNDELENRPVGLFTSELYRQDKYVLEQLEDLVGPAKAFNLSEVVFAVTPKFIEEKTLMNYDGTIIILTGCFGLYSFDLPQAFINRGASVVIGWDGLVEIEHTDKAILVFLRMILLDKMNIEDAVLATIAEVGPDPYYDSILSYYPSIKGDVTILACSIPMISRIREKSLKVDRPYSPFLP